MQLNNSSHSLDSQPDSKADVLVAVPYHIHHKSSRLCSRNLAAKGKGRWQNVKGSFGHIKFDCVSVYEFPEDAVTRYQYHKLGGLKQIYSLAIIELEV